MSGPYSAVLSLGSECETTFQIQRFFRSNRPHSPFDWLVSPTNALLDILHDHGSRLGQKVIASGGGHSAICAEYGVLYHHEFPRRDGMVVFSAEALERCRSKLSYKMAQFRTVGKNNKTLFVRGGIATNLGGDVHARSEVPNSLLNLLAKRVENTIENPDFAIAVLVRRGVLSGGRVYSEAIAPDVPLDPRVFISPYPITLDTPSGGDPVPFQQMFRSFGLTETSQIGGKDGADSPEYN